MATAVLPALKQTFPTAQIGLLVGSWSKAAVVGHPSVQWIHVVDHWILNRSMMSRGKKILIYFRSRAQSLREIRGIRYDVAIDLYYYFPNSAVLLWQSGIPVRIGYSSGGFGPLLTICLEWANHNWSVTNYHAALLKQIGVSEDAVSLRASLPPITAPSATVAQSSGYLVLHVGAGGRAKKWPTSRWQELARRLAEADYRLIFTGVGFQERAEIDKIIHALPNCVNLCSELGWQEFVAIVKSAQLLVGVDSVAVHVAAAVDTPSIEIGNGISNPYHWRPVSDRSVVLMNPVPCAPCYLNSGCLEMLCVRGVSVDSVLAEIKRALPLPIANGGDFS